MATRKPRIIDPAETANKAILAEREQRIEAKRKPLPDLGLVIPESDAGTAAEFLADEFDKRTFGPAAETISKVVYGPDTLLDQSPTMKETIERIGLVDYAAATKRAILDKGAMAFSDDVLRQGVHRAIARFGAEAVAQSFADRIMKIPVRTVEYEVDRDLDIEIEGSRVLGDAVSRHKRPGMAYKFLAPRCVDVLGLRGYQIVKDENGDPVKVGTLMLGEISQVIADRRRAYYENQSKEAIATEVAKYEEETERLARNSGHRGVGPLRADEVITANASENEGNLGLQRTAGFSIEDITA